MTERPILFSGEMVKAILAGRKAQTRRVVKPQPLTWHTVKRLPYCGDNGEWSPLAGHSEDRMCPYGKPGDRLYVKETFALMEAACGTPVVNYRAGGYLVHGATGEKRNGTWKDEAFAGTVDAIGEPDTWTPSIFMPRWASRITLEVTDVRVERVHDISEEDARAEGLECVEGRPGANWRPGEFGYSGVGRGFYHVEADGKCRCKVGLPSAAVCAYAELWDKINAKRGFSWGSNPFVWVIEFNRLEGR